MRSVGKAKSFLKIEFDLKDQTILTFKNSDLTKKPKNNLHTQILLRYPRVRNEPAPSLPTEIETVKQFRCESDKITRRYKIFMAEIAEEQPGSSSMTQLRLQTKEIAFKPDDFTECDGCYRRNPPNRLKCLYCGHDLDIKPENAASILVMDDASNLRPPLF